MAFFSPEMDWNGIGASSLQTYILSTPPIYEAQQVTSKVKFKQ